MNTNHNGYQPFGARMVLLAAVLLFGEASGYAQSFNVTIKGTIDQMTPGTRVYYQWYDKDHLTPDFANNSSVVSEGNKFTIKLHVKKGEGNELMLVLGGKIASGKVAFLYVDQGTVNFHTRCKYP